MDFKFDYYIMGYYLRIKSLLFFVQHFFKVDSLINKISFNCLNSNSYFTTFKAIILYQIALKNRQ